MNLFEWFRRRVGKRVIVDIAGLKRQTWRIYMVGGDIVSLVQPSSSKKIEQVNAYYTGISYFADPIGVGAVVGGEWDAAADSWRLISRAELLKGRPPDPDAPAPDIPDHLPDDIG